MRLIKWKLIFALLSGLALLGLNQLARGADYPQKPLKIIMPYPPGGGGDVVARFIASKLGDRLKQPVVVENRSGAGGMVGTGVGARSAPDGYTIVFAHADTLSINPHVYRSTISYDARRDFTPVALLGARPFAIAVHPRVAANTVPEFIKLVKGQPDKLSYATWGVGSSSHIGMVMLTGGDPKLMLHVPYQGQAPAVAALIAGQVDAIVGSLAVTGPHHQAGRLKILAVTTPQRLSGAPNVPTLIEQGIDLTIADWYGFVVPSKVPSEVITVLNRELNALLKETDVHDFLAKKAGMEVSTGCSPEECRAILDKAYAQWGKTVSEANIKAD